MTEDGYRSRQPRDSRLVARNVRVMLYPEDWERVDLIMSKNEWTMARVVSYLLAGYMRQFAEMQQTRVARDAQDMFREGLARLWQR